MVYDPLGRLFQLSTGSTSTQFLYDGDALVAEYNANGNLAERYVHGAAAGADDPLIWYHGAGLTDRRWLHADHQGSIIAMSNGTGTMLAINRYDEYGIPGTGNTGRFQYTGQIWLSEIGVYHYKARAYSPTIGRMMQTDFIGYDDQINLYAYVGNDPVNRTDPTGLEWEDPRLTLHALNGMAADLRAHPLNDQQRSIVMFMMRNTPITGPVTRVMEIVASITGGGPPQSAESVAEASVPGRSVASTPARRQPTGIVYRRTDRNTGRCYIGRCNNEQNYRRRQSDHRRANPNADYDFEILDRAEPGLPLRQGEQRGITAHGGPTNASNPAGGTENRRNEIRQCTGTRICR